MRLRSADANEPKIHQMHIAAGHHLEIGARGFGQISRHDCGASPQKCERRSQHTCHPHWHEFFDAGSILRLKDRNRVGSSARAPEFRMGRARYIAAKGLPIRHPLSARQTGCVEIVEPREFGSARTLSKEIFEPGQCVNPTVRRPTSRDNCSRLRVISISLQSLTGRQPPKQIAFDLMGRSMPKRPDSPNSAQCVHAVQKPD